MALIDLIAMGGRRANEPSLGEIALEKRKIAQKDVALEQGAEDLRRKRERLMMEMDIYADKKNKDKLRGKITQEAYNMHPDSPVDAADFASKRALQEGDMEFAADSEKFRDDALNALPTDAGKYLTQESIQNYYDFGHDPAVLEMRPEVLNPQTNDDLLSSDKYLTQFLPTYAKDPTSLPPAIRNAVEKKFFRGEESAMSIATFVLGNNVEAMRQILTAKSPDQRQAAMANLVSIIKEMQQVFNPVKLTTDEEAAFKDAKAMNAKQTAAGKPQLTDAQLEAGGVNPDKFRAWSLQQ